MADELQHVGAVADPRRERFGGRALSVAARTDGSFVLTALFGPWSDKRIALFDVARERVGRADWRLVAAERAESPLGKGGLENVDYVAAGADFVVACDPGGDSGAGANSGMAAVWTRPAGSDRFGRTTALLAGSASAGWRFGRSVAADGDMFIVGEFYTADEAGTRGSGFLFRYDAEKDTVNHVAHLVPPRPGECGSSVALQGDMAVLGCWFLECATCPSNEGGFFVFHRNKGGADAWGLHGAGDDFSLTSYSGQGHYGYRSAVSGDGQWVVVGSKNDLNPAALMQFKGTEYVFRGLAHRPNSGSVSYWPRAIMIDDDTLDVTFVSQDPDEETVIYAIDADKGTWSKSLSFDMAGGGAKAGRLLALGHESEHRIDLLFRCHGRVRCLGETPWVAMGLALAALAVAAAGVVGVALALVRRRAVGTVDGGGGGAGKGRAATLRSTRDKSGSTSSTADLVGQDLVESLATPVTSPLESAFLSSSSSSFSKSSSSEPYLSSSSSLSEAVEPVAFLFLEGASAAASSSDEAAAPAAVTSSSLFLGDFLGDKARSIAL